MATQGLLSITLGGKVMAKIITGCDGKRIVPLAAWLRAHCKAVDGDELLKLCHAHDLGGESLIVQTSPTDWHCDTADQELPPLYVEKFDDPDFNPRWQQGTAEYTERVELEPLPEGEDTTTCNGCGEEISEEESNENCGYCNSCA